MGKFLSPIDLVFSTFHNVTVRLCANRQSASNCMDVILLMRASETEEEQKEADGEYEKRSRVMILIYIGFVVG